ncbi:hypothetical protein LTR53_015105, partial [Teratosphaeriaceae sp. CCFEE 6253]
SATKFTYLSGAYFMGAYSGLAGEANEGSDVFFNDLDQLTSEDWPSRLYVEAMERTITAVQMEYTNGKVITHRVKPCLTAGTAQSAFYLWDYGNVPIKTSSVVVRAHVYDGRTLMDMMVVSADSDAFRNALLTAPTASAASQNQRTSHGSVPPGWDMVGFWGHIVPNVGFSGLSIVQRKLRPAVANAVTPPPLWEEHGADDLRDDIKNSWQAHNTKGKYWRLSKCVGNSVANAAPFGTPNPCRPTKIIFRMDNRQLTRIYADRENGYEYVDPAVNEYGLGVAVGSLDIPLGSAASISQVVIKQAHEKKGDTAVDQDGGSTCVAYIEIHHSMPTPASPFKIGVDPGESAAKVVAVRPLDVDAGQKWAFRGFYGANGRYIDRLGVIWARE